MNKNQLFTKTSLKAYQKPSGSVRNATKKSAEADLVHLTSLLIDWTDNLKTNISPAKQLVKSLNIRGVDLPGVEPGRFGLSDQSSKPAKPTPKPLSQNGLKNSSWTKVIYLSPGNTGLGTTKISTPVSDSKNTLPENSLGDTSFNNLDKADSNFESTGGWTLNTTMPADSDGPTAPKLAKSLSLVNNTQDSLSAKANTAPFFNPLGQTNTEKPSFFKNEVNRTSTFSSSKNLSLAGFSVKGDIADSFDLLGGKMESGFNSAGGQSEIAGVDFFSGQSRFQKLQNLPNHNSGALENRFAMTDLGINNNSGKTFNSHNNTNYTGGSINVNGRMTRSNLVTVAYL